jgi:lipoyl synthase
MTMTDLPTLTAPSRATPETHQRGRDKVARLPVKVQQLAGTDGTQGSASGAETATVPLRKPDWIRARAPVGPAVTRVKRLLREQGLATVCEEAQCPNLGECFGHGTATFMILGDLCTRRCPFCDVAHGRPRPPDPAEPGQLAEAIGALGLRYVVITSVDRDDLRDGGAGHFAACVRTVRMRSPATRIEVLVPDFRGREALALAEFAGNAVPDVFNHNLETVPRLYCQARPGADYRGSLALLQSFKALHPCVPTKSGLMLGLGEEHEEVLAAMADLRAHGCDMLTLGQYLQPSRDHLPVQRYWNPAEFEALRVAAEAMGFANVASGAMVRSSYHADRQAADVVGAALGKVEAGQRPG